MATIASYIQPAGWQFQWLCHGVDPKFPGNGGAECARFLGPAQRLLETALVLAVCALEMRLAWPRLGASPGLLAAVERQRRRSGQGEAAGKRALLVVTCVVFGAELGMKCATGTLIYTMNPCHVLTLVQIYLLAVPPSKTALIVFRAHMSALSGPFLAIVFPVLNTRLLPCETELYWVQHILIYLVIPPYLMSLGGAYTCEPLSNFSWVMFMTGAQFIYHFVALQGVALLVHVNLNNMLCPAPSDPFHSPWYRMFALVHQHVLLPAHLKLYTLVMRLIIPACPDLVNGDVVKKSH